MKRLIVGGVDCTHLETVATLLQFFPAESVVTEVLQEKMAATERANRVYLKKRGTKRLVELMWHSFWKAPHRAALIFSVLNSRISAARASDLRVGRAKAHVGKGASV